MRKSTPWKTVGWLVCLSLLAFVGQGESWRPSLAASPAPLSTVTVTKPSGAATDVVAEGDDFFTRVLGDRRDMNERLDLRWQVGISNISVASGIWQGNWSANSSVYAHYPGHDIGAANIGPIGTQYPIDTSTYRQLSFRIYSSSSTSYEWSAYPGYLVEGGNSVATGSVTGGQWKTYVHTLTSNWSGSMQGLRFRLVQPSSDFRFDWVRLTDPDTSPTYNITWSGAGSGTVDIYCDDDINYSNGTIAQIADNTSNDGSFTWQTAAFPPGDYYIYIEHSGDSPGGGDYSSGPLTIVEAPILDFTAPSVSSGDDYATAELNSPWDMSSDSSIRSEVWSRHHIESPCPCFANGEMYGTTSGNDPFVYPNLDKNKPVNASKYKYLSWRWYVEGDWTDSHDRLTSANGWVTRFHYFSGYHYDINTNMNTLNDIIIWEGWNSYTVDLSQGYLDDEAPGPGGGWAGTIYGLRFDFLEGTNPFNFHVDWVLLTADPTAQAGSTYDIQWTIQASERPMTITLKYDSDQNPNNGFAGNIATLTPGGSGTPPSGSYLIYLPLVTRNYDSTAPTQDSYRWSVPLGLSGSYYIYAEVNDGVNISEWYSKVPVVISS